MDRLWLGAMSPRLQASTWVPAGPVMTHEPCAGCESMDQLTPVPPGRLSFTVTAVAVPDLMLLTTIVKPTEPPTSTGLASCLFVMVSSGQCTVSDAWLVNGPPFSLPTDTEAVFG